MITPPEGENYVNNTTLPQGCQEELAWSWDGGVEDPKEKELREWHERVRQKREMFAARRLEKTRLRREKAVQEQAKREKNLREKIERVKKREKLRRETATKARRKRAAEKKRKEREKKRLKREGLRLMKRLEKKEARMGEQRAEITAALEQTDPEFVTMRRKVRIKATEEVDLVRDIGWVYQNLRDLIVEPATLGGPRALNQKLLDRAPSSGAIAMAQYACDDPGAFFTRFVVKLLPRDLQAKEEVSEREKLLNVDPEFEGLEKYFGVI